MIQRYDLIIVGGSFAGLACARTAALKGLKVAVIDAKPEAVPASAPPALSSKKRATISICLHI